MKYKEPQEFFKYLIEEFGYSVFKDSRKCLAIASDMFDWNKQIEFLFKTAENNKVYETLLKAKDSTSENKLICIENAIKILTDDCCLDNYKATTAVSWLAQNLYSKEWSNFISKIPSKSELISNSNTNKKNNDVEKLIKIAQDNIKTKNYEEALNILKPFLTNYKEKNTKKGLDYLLEKAKVLFNSKQYKEAYALFEQVADLGNFEGQIWLDYMQKNGLGVEKTYNPTAYKQDFSDSMETSFNVNFDYNSSNFPSQNVENFNDIFDAVKSAKYIETIERMLKNGVDPNCISTPYAYTPLIWAARNNSNPEILNILLQYGADPNMHEANNWNSLMFVANQSQNVNCLQILLEYGAKPNKTNSDGNTALDLVDSRNMTQMVDLLLQYGAKVTWKYIQKHNKNSWSSNSSDNSSYENNSSGCFITTAVCDSFKKTDDCYELTMFRQFRDNWLTNEEDGKALIKEYYNNAPKIVEAINACKNHKEIYLNIWNTYLKACLQSIENKKYEECKALYVKMVKELEKEYC